MVHLYDLMIGDYDVSQGFGDNPATYNWIKDINGNPIKGHDGVDVATPTGVSLLNPFPKESVAFVTAVGFDPNGYGNYIRIWDKTQNCVILYGHCQTILVKVGDTLFFQQEVAKSDNTGWSTGPHCHVGFYMVDSSGLKLNRANGFDGYVNILDRSVVNFTVLEPKTPAIASAVVSVSTPPSVAPVAPAVVSIPLTTNERLVTNSDNYQRVIDFLNLNMPADTTPSKTVITAITSLVGSATDLKIQLATEQKANASTSATLNQEINNKDEETKRLQQQLIDNEHQYETELKNVPDFTSLKKQYDDRYATLYAKYEQAMKDKGAVLNQLAGLKNDVVTVAKTSLGQKILDSILHIFSL